jgi:apolipoprotein D and lipocalin family protein
MIFSCFYPFGKAGGFQIPRCQGIAVKDYGVTLGALALKPSRFCNVGVAWFQKGCTGSTADYSLLPDGRIRVVNRCFKKNLDGPLKVSKGKAQVVDTTTRAKLKVWFFWPFKGDYWIIDLDPDYQWAVVGVPSRKYLWILSRTPALDRVVYDGILRRIIEKGYDPTRLQLTPQPQ